MENLREDFKSGYIFPQNYFESEYQVSNSSLDNY